jgi:ribokinase
MNIFRKKPKHIDFIAIGDITIDAFIKLNEASKTHIIPHSDGTREIALPFGDKIPFESSDEIVAVGNSANAAVSAARLGISSALIAPIGTDENAQKCIVQLQKEGVSTEYIASQKGKKTNYHYVLWYKDERTILIKHETFEYQLPQIENPRVIYLSSLSDNTLPFHNTIADFLDTHPETMLVFQPGTFQMKWGADALSRIYTHSHLFFCNYEEAERILNLPIQTKSNESIIALLKKLRHLGPALPIITDGPNGAYTFACDGTGDKRVINYEKVIHMPVYPDIADPFERTGAGDAFASTFTVAYMLGNSIEESLKWASINSMNVCQHVGAQIGLLTREKISAYLASAPEQFKAETL